MVPLAPSSPLHTVHIHARTTPPPDTPPNQERCGVFPPGHARRHLAASGRGLLRQPGGVCTESQYPGGLGIGQFEGTVDGDRSDDV